MAWLNGNLLNMLITAAIIAAAGAVANGLVLTYRANASEEKVEAIDQRQRVLGMNQAALVRDSAWTTDMLKVLLTKQRIPIPPPPPLKEIR